MKKQKPLSKNQGGNWWIIRRPNGSVMPDSLARTRKGTWKIFLNHSPAKGIMDYALIKRRVRDGYTCEKVQICSASKTLWYDNMMTYERHPIRGPKRIVSRRGPIG